MKIIRDFAWIQHVGDGWQHDIQSKTLVSERTYAIKSYRINPKVIKVIKVEVIATNIQTKGPKE